MKTAPKIRTACAALLGALLLAPPAAAEDVVPALPIKGCVTTYYGERYAETGIAVHNFDCPYSTDFYAAIDGKLVWVDSVRDGDGLERHQIQIRGRANDKPVLVQYRFWSRKKDIARHLDAAIGSQVTKGQKLGQVPTTYINDGLYLYTFAKGDFGRSDPKDWFR